MSRTTIDQTLRDHQITYEDTSYYLPKGSKNSHRQIESRGQNQRTSDDFSNPLFQFEMKFDSLKNYVDSVTTAVNQHASLLNKLKAEINLRVVEKNLSETINKFAECISVKDLDPSFMITAVHENIDSKDEEGSFKSSVTNFCNKLEIVGGGFSKVNKIGQTVTVRMQEIENSLGKKVSGADVKEKVKKAKTKIRGEIENNNKKIEEKIKAMEKRCLEKYENLEKRFNRLDQNMIEGHREQNLDGMINKADFSSLTQEIEEKLMKEINRVISQNTEEKEQETAEFRTTLKNIEEKTNKQISDMKKAIEEANASFAKKSEALRQEDVEKEINRLLTKNMKAFGEPFEESCTKLKQQVEAINKSIKNMESSSQNNGNCEKLAEVEQVTAKTQLDIDSLNEKVNELAKALKEKFVVNEAHALSRSKSEKFDVANISDFIQAEEEKHKKISKTIEDLEQKVDKVNQNFDRKAAKLKKEFDLDSLIKQFKSKADESNVQKNFENFEAKISGLGENFVLLKRELDMLSKGYCNSAKPNDSAFISIKSALPKACLSCGGNSAPLHQINNSFVAKRPEKPHLKEKDSSVDRPSTASYNLKMKIITGSAMVPNMNMTSTQGFGITPLRVSGARPDSIK